MITGSISSPGSNVMSKVYILGGAQTDFERNWKKEGKGMVALLKEAMADGLENAGLSFDDVKALNGENYVAFFLLETLSLRSM